MRVFATVGFPAAQIKLPAVMNALFAEAGIDAAWVALEISPAAVAETARALLGIGNVGGLSVTIPFKATLAALCTELSEAARIAGAVNVVRRAADGRIVGDLFDGIGFVHHHERLWKPVAGDRFALVGAGGAGLAVAQALLAAGAAEVRLHDLDAGRAAAAAIRLAAAYPGRVTAVRSMDELVGDVLVNCSPAGMLGDPSLPVPAAMIDRFVRVADIVMEPERTPLLAAAEARGLPTLGGRGMLAAQVDCYRAFFGV